MSEEEWGHGEIVRAVQGLTGALGKFEERVTAEINALDREFYPREVLDEKLASLRADVTALKAAVTEWEADRKGTVRFWIEQLAPIVAGLVIAIVTTRLLG